MSECHTCGAEIPAHREATGRNALFTNIQYCSDECRMNRPRR